MSAGLLIQVALAAAVYASVGHGGASAYLAILSLHGVPSDQMATSALLLNILVAGVSLAAYAGAGYLSARLVLPFLVSSIPAAFVGGLLHVSPRVYGLLLALALAFAAVRLWWTPVERVSRPVAWGVALTAGAAIGLLSGIVGVGGGIFLSPLMILAGWAGAKSTSATAAAFIVANSLAGLAGRASRGGVVLGPIWPLIPAAFVGGLAGAGLGAYKFLPLHLRRILAVLLVFVAVKNLATWLGAR